MANNPIKKIHRVCDKSIIVIDESLAVKLGLDNDNSWAEQKQYADDEILLKVKRL